MRAGTVAQSALAALRTRDHMLASFFVTGGAAAAGWTSYAPLSAVPAYTGVDWGQNLWCISLIILGFSSLMGSVNYITTVVNMIGIASASCCTSDRPTTLSRRSTPPRPRSDVSA